jgi:hypothetical protein
METWQWVITVISNFGFPMAMCLLFWQFIKDQVKMIQQNTEAINRLSDQIEDLLRDKK